MRFGNVWRNELPYNCSALLLYRTISHIGSIICNIYNIFIYFIANSAIIAM